MKKTKKDGKIGRIQKAGMVDQGFYFSDDNQQEPAESEHMCIYPKKDWYDKFYGVPGFPEILLFRLSRFSGKYVFSDYAFFFLGERTNPTGISDEQIYQEDIQTEGEGKNEGVVIHDWDNKD